MYRPAQLVCSQQECQRKRRSEYHRKRIRNDAAYAEDVRASQSKWRQANPDYWKRYREQNPKSVERNRQKRAQRDQKRRVVNLAKMNLALDLKREASEVWFVGPVVKDLAKNNLGQSKVFIYQGFRASGVG
jgi:23S rRNA G2445 N2-methylase RlmL